MVYATGRGVGGTGRGCRSANENHSQKKSFKNNGLNKPPIKLDRPATCKVTGFKKITY